MRARHRSAKPALSTGWPSGDRGLTALPGGATFSPADCHMLELQTPVQFVKGVGPGRARDLAAKNIHTVEDLLYTLPYRYEDRTRFCPVRELRPGEKTSVLVEVMSTGLTVTRKSRLKIFDLSARDKTGGVRCKWFHSEYLHRRKIFRRGQQVILYGKFEPAPYGAGSLQVINPEFEILDVDAEVSSQDSIEMGRIVPVYEAARGLGTRTLRRLIHTVLSELSDVPETLPPAILERHDLMDRRAALQESHFPSAETCREDLAARRTSALRRLIFEELFLLEVGIRWKRRLARNVRGMPFRIDPGLLRAAGDFLPFRPTRAQERVLNEMSEDMRRPNPMNRLLQGDVGCGKTVVALQAGAIAIENGAQAAFMAPTEILAEQHHHYARRLFDQSGYRVGLLTSGLKKAARRDLLEELSQGRLQLLIGTHALLEPDVAFRKLGLVIIDEQHRFGVRQRFNLMKKGAHPHTLVMTATPIPRTLSMTLYGDLDVSVIDEMPPNRRSVKTHLLDELKRSRAYRFIADQVRQGRQIYVLCPLIEESEKLDLRPARKIFEHLQGQVFPDFRVELLHGRLKNIEKDAIMKRFAAGHTDILVSTTVIEVGMDVANATVMLIEHAERFGLAQLHQLRGRVGRGPEPSYCLLMQGAGTIGPEAFQRLNCLRETTDGFVIAEKDLEIRGPGEFFGTRQSGLPTLRVADLLRDRRILETARREAATLVDNFESQESLVQWAAGLSSGWQARYGLVGVG